METLDIINVLYPNHIEEDVEGDLLYTIFAQFFGQNITIFYFS